MDFTLPPEIEDYRRRVRAFVAEHLVPLESRPENYDPEHDNISFPLLDAMRAKAKAAGLWAPQMPKARGGLGLGMVGQAAFYEAANYGIFGPATFNCAAPDDGNMRVLEQVATEAQKERWLQPVVDGRLRSAFAMTEPHPGSGSDPAGMMLTRAEKVGAKWVVHGHKWFITAAGAASHFILVARTSDDPRRGLSAFLFHRDQPGWRIVRKVPIMGPEEHGGHCELRFEGLEIPEENLLMAVGDGLRLTQIRLGPARLTHCMRWLGLTQRAMAIARGYVGERRSFGKLLAEHEGVQWLLGQAAADVQIGRLLVMHAAWKLDRGEKARKEISTAKIQVAETLNRVVGTCLQLCGARGYSRDTLLQWMYRYAPQAKLVDGASEVHRMVLSRFYMAEGDAYWGWN
jgi:acyl-CoA dehydrogenase